MSIDTLQIHQLKCLQYGNLKFHGKFDFFVSILQESNAAPVRANADPTVNATAPPASAASVSILDNYYIDLMFAQYDTVNNDKTKHNFFTWR